MPLTVGQLREILQDPTITDDLPVTFVHAVNMRHIADSAFGSAVIERDSKSHAPVTGRVTEANPEILKGERQKVFALYDR